MQTHSSAAVLMPKSTHALHGLAGEIPLVEKKKNAAPIPDSQARHSHPVLFMGTARLQLSGGFGLILSSSRSCVHL